MLANSLGNTPQWIHLAKELQSLLKQIRIPYFTHTNKLVWTANPSGSFSVKSPYNLLVASFHDCCSWKEVWNSQLIHKINFFWWMTLHGKVLTIDNLKRRGFMLANKCVMCSCAEESINHLFIHCTFASGVWYKVLQKFNLAWTFLEDLLQFINNRKYPSAHSLVTLFWRLIPPHVYWHIWKERNNRIFRDTGSSVDMVTDLAENYLRENAIISKWRTLKSIPMALDQRWIKTWNFPDSFL